MIFGTGYVTGSGTPLRGTGSSAFRLTTSPAGATAYCVDRQMAKRFVLAQEPVRRFADFPVDLSAFGGMPVVPRLVDSPSDAELSQIGGNRRGVELKLWWKRTLQPGYVRDRILRRIRKLTSRKVPKPRRVPVPTR